MRLDEDRLQDILEAIGEIERHLPETWDAFDANELVKVWCLRHLEIIGEAAAGVSETTRILSPAIPWKQIVGMRNALIHAYFNVNWRRVWAVLSGDLAALKVEVRRVLGQLETQRSPDGEV